MARILADRGWEVTTCVEGRSARTCAGATEAGATLLPTLSDVVGSADLVISLVPQNAVLQTAEAFAEAARHNERRPLYLDANSVSPATMREVCAMVAKAGTDCIDGAFVGNAGMLGSTTALYVSGARAEEVRDLIGEAFPVRVLGPSIGFASAFKLSFGGFNKGLVALFLEMVSASDRIGQRQELMQALRAFYPGSVETVERLLPTYPQHAARRAEEMVEVEEWLRGMGQRGPMAASTCSVLADLAGLGLPGDAALDAEGVVREACRRSLLAESSSEG